MQGKAMKTFCVALLLVLACSVQPVFADTGMKIVTNKGYVGFVVADDWMVQAMDTKGAIARIAFQLPNPSDAGTPESTNLVLVLYDLATKQGREGYHQPIKQYGSKAPDSQVIDGWTVYRQQGLQGTVDYTILDAKRNDVADRAAYVRLAWPHLSGNAPGYDEYMERTFRQFLGSVQGRRGLYKPDKGEVLRRNTTP